MKFGMQTRGRIYKDSYVLLLYVSIEIRIVELRIDLLNFLSTTLYVRIDLSIRKVKISSGAMASGCTENRLS